MNNTKQEVSIFELERYAKPDRPVTQAEMIAYAKTQRDAALTVCALAPDVATAAELLDILGLRPKAVA